MEVALIEPANSLNINLLTNESYELTLNQSIQNLLHEHRKGISEFSSFLSNFYDLMQARVDPPLEAIWVYSALSFRSSNFKKDDALNRISIAKDLFQLSSACSASCSSSKSVALLAPVVFEVYNSVVELLGKDLSLKREKKAMRAAVSLIEVILGFISVCCGKDSSEEDGNWVGLIASFSDLVCLWMEGNGEGKEGLDSFLPLAGEEVCRGLSEGGCDVSYLAGVVIAEAFLMRLCLNIRVGLARREMEKELRNWAVGSITGFRNYYFFETLARMLLEPTLPVTSLLNSEDEDLLRRVLYDAVILVEYSFLNPRVIQPPAERMKSLAMTRLIVMHEAIEFFRYEEMKISIEIIIDLSLQNLMIWSAAEKMGIRREPFLI
ncbi:hypothetical protein L1049_022826 [Liquidambar formosana]|uniref:Uncharacterized protein n=1 Tax=Liquidambar formosana TaxID=63359 RepID=A0AAP0WPG7_LIQFO